MPTSDPSGERHDHQGQDSTAQAEPVGAGQRDEQRVEGVPDHGLFAPAVLRDPQEPPDLRGGRADRPPARRLRAAPQPGVAGGRGSHPGACAGPSHAWRASGLRWEHVHGDRAVLPDSKTGPRTIWLSSPALGALRVDAITRADVALWFHEYGREWPGGANRAHDILRDMFARTIAWGHRPEAAGNPCAGIVRYRLPPRGRLLGTANLARLGAVLRRLESRLPVKVAAVRLILLTGCRSGEVRRLQWRDVKCDRLVLHESKTGPRQVPLGKAAQQVLDRMSKTRSGEWVFPGALPGCPLSEQALYDFWRRVRDEAGIVADARLHDLRHSHASHAIMNGESLHMVGRLLGHRRATTTNRYAHLDDATLSDAAERVAVEIEQKLCHPDHFRP